MTDVLEHLTAAERDLLAECEDKIRRGLSSFLEVGSALLDVRDNRLYRAAFPTFEAYCAERWGISRPRAYELMTAAEVVSAMADIAPEVPANERQARELARVPEDERAEVWAETLARTDGQPTAAAVREVARERAPQSHPVGDGAAGPTTGDDGSGIAAVEGGVPAGEPQATAPAAAPEDAGRVPAAATVGSPVAPAVDGPVAASTGPSTVAEPDNSGLFADHSEGDARRDRELDDAMADTAVRFRRNFGDVFGALPKIWDGFSPDRVAEVYARDFQHSIADVLDQFDEWASRVRAAHRRQTSGLRVVAGGRS